MEPRILAMIATVMETCAAARKPRRGRPPARVVRVLAQLAPVSARGRALGRPEGDVGGGQWLTLRRCLADWAAINLLQRVPAVLVAMLRSNPD